MRGTQGRDRDGCRWGALVREKLQRNNISWHRLAGKTMILLLRPQFRGDTINLLLAIPLVKPPQGEGAQLTRLFPFVPDRNISTG